jgi:transcriptional regulator with XRE-family HTH domain
MNTFKRLRMVAGLTQTDIARRLKVSVAAVSLWEAGQTMPAPDKVPALARVLRIPPATLIEALAPSLTPAA